MRQYSMASINTKVVFTPLGFRVQGWENRLKSREWYIMMMGYLLLVRRLCTVKLDPHAGLIADQVDKTQGGSGCRLNFQLLLHEDGSLACFMRPTRTYPSQ